MSDTQVTRYGGSATVEEGVKDAVDLISTANALGLEIPAPVGCVMYEAYVSLSSDYDVDINLGFYSTEESAYTAARDWVVSEWDAMYSDTGVAPWLTDGGWDRIERTIPGDSTAKTDTPEYEACLAEVRGDWLTARSSREIVETYFGDNDQHDTIHITKQKIEKDPAGKF